MEPNLAWLEDPQVFRVNRLDAHSDHHFYESTEDMKAGKETLRQSLNGTWKFAWSEKPSDRPAEFYREEADLTSFGEIQVPGHIELQGHDQIHYINTMYPWEGHVFLRPPHIDWNHDPVGSYVKEFDLEPGLVGKRVCISFQGVEEAMYVWLNGVFIGYAEDSFTPSEFDLTEIVRKKGNRLCVEVYKRSSAAWLEDQDFFRFSGIFRDVYLYGKPVAHVEDLWAKAGLEEDYSTGNLVIEAKVSGAAAQVEWQVLDPAGKEVAQGALEKVLENSAVDNFVADGSNANYAAGQTILWTSKKQLFSDVAKWDVGQPNLYQLILLVKDADDNVLEAVPYKIGFRRFEIKDKLMLLNGKRLIINGVNRHEWNPRRGRSITEEDMRKDIEIMKKNNINAVRTCHYPDQSLWYQLCDEAGICLMDETNLESHGSWQKMGQCEPSWNVPGSDSRWEACVVDRATSMLERDKNHPAILWWSCGNESYAGTCILAMSRYFHEKDPSRRVHYEGVFWNRQFEEISDVESRMYASPAEVRAYLENDPRKPYLLCEYMHDMGNSIGGMENYIKLLDEFPMYQGGFIWDYIDQAIYHKNQKGQEVLGYGGDFMDRPTDYAFSGNGIVFADRTEKPAMQEVRYWYSTPQERASLDQEKKAGYEKTFKRLKEEHEALQKTAGEKAAQMQVIHGDLTYGVRGRGLLCNLWLWRRRTGVSCL
ncbi:MAG: glycoside hydrolase family 2 TIM barrel-domain containing protein [Blautia sp.]